MQERSKVQSVAVPHGLFRILEKNRNETVRSCILCKPSQPGTAEVRRIRVKSADSNWVVSGRSFFASVCRPHYSLIVIIGEKYEQIRNEVREMVPDMVRKTLQYRDCLELEEDKFQKVNLLPAVFAYLWEARHCFRFGFYLASMALASAAVEVAINSDWRVNKKQQEGSWFTLRAALRRALDEKLPVELLLDKDERSSMSFDSHNSIRFIDRRNKVAHGNIQRIGAAMYPMWTTDVEKQAYDQLLKAQIFLLQWAKAGRAIAPRRKIRGTAGRAWTSSMMVNAGALLSHILNPYDDRWL